MPDTSTTAEAQSTASGLSKVDGNRLAPGTLAYDLTMKMQGRSLDLSSTQEITATTTSGTETWTAITTTETPRATVTDSLVVHRNSLRPVARHLGGPMSLDVTYSDTSASGTMSVRGRSATIDKSFSKPMLAGGSNTTLALASLPLTRESSATLSFFNERQQSVQTRTYSVQGTETVQTPAGSFETYVIKMSSMNGDTSGTLYVRTEAPHYLVKATMEQSGPQGSRTISQTLSSLDIAAASASGTE
jgi:hypothetical protein